MRRCCAAAHLEHAGAVDEVDAPVRKQRDERILCVEHAAEQLQDALQLLLRSSIQQLRDLRDLQPGVAVCRTAGTGLRRSTADYMRAAATE